MVISFMTFSAQADYWDALKIVGGACGAAFCSYKFIKDIKKEQLPQLEKKEYELHTEIISLDGQIQTHDTKLRAINRAWLNPITLTPIRAFKYADNVAEKMTIIDVYQSQKDTLKTKKTERDRILDLIKEGKESRFASIFFGTGTAIFSGIALWGIKQTFKNN
jgi:hypothetical protein